MTNTLFNLNDHTGHHARPAAEPPARGILIAIGHKPATRRAIETAEQWHRQTHEANMNEPIIITRAQLDSLHNLRDALRGNARQARMIEQTMSTHGQPQAAAHAEGLALAYEQAAMQLAAIIGED